MKSTELSRSVQVFIEIGHRASCRSPDKKTQFKTHDWVLFVRGKDSKDGIHHFIDKVVFRLHESFENPVRTVREPPFKLQESGYGIFLAKIEVYFRLKDGQSKQVYEHDITLPADGDKPIELALTEKLTFNNVSEDFVQRVLDGGGTLIDDQFAGAPKQRGSGKVQVQKKSRKQLDTVSSMPQSISPELKSCSKEIEKRQWEVSLFGGEPEVLPKRVRSEGTNSPLTVDKETALKKKTCSELLKPKKRKTSVKAVDKEVKSNSRPSLPEGNTKPAANKKMKLEPESETKPSLAHKDILRDVQEDHSSLEKKKAPKKPSETLEEASSDNFESDNDVEKEVMTSSNEEDQRSVAVSGLPYYELESIYSKVMSLNPDDGDELMLSYKVYKILQATGKGYDDDGICFDMHQLDLPIILQIKEIMQC